MFNRALILQTLVEDFVKMIHLFIVFSFVIILYFNMFSSLTFSLDIIP